jgi:two-component system CheB/CheR fusion protein
MAPKNPLKKAGTPAEARQEAVSKRAPASPNPFLIVGIGASAGGLEAFTKLIHELPAKTGAAYVLVQHLDPTHESALSGLLARSTVLPVTEVRETLRVEADHIYIMPAAMDLAIADGHLKLLPRTLSHGRHMPIDFFFRSLAEVQAEKAIGVILSGTGSDGTVGLQAIKASGGICLAQEPQSAKYDGMPWSAITAGCVDTILPPETLAREIARLADAFRGALRPEGAGLEPRSDAASLERILGHVGKITGNDLRSYKEPTLMRRVRRRMALHRMTALEGYVRFLESHPAEVYALYEDLLIHVTSFFRGDASFRSLSQKVFPELLKDRTTEPPLRFWVPGCSTGEEVYSLAICLLESLGEMGKSLPIQIFGTDIRPLAIEQARAGIYLENIAADVSPERLERFFVRTEDRFQVTKPVRDLCVFAQHDLIRDPPFSRMDLISCRNVLIYFTPETQKTIFANFHYALKADGYLVLGSSENAGTAARLFRALDREHKIFVPTAVAARPVFGGGGRGIYPRAGLPPPAAGGRADVQREADRILLGRYSPPGILVDTNLEILLFRGDTQPYLEHGQGDANLSLPQMAQKGLLASLREMIQEVQATAAPVRREAVKFRHLEGFRSVDLEVLPVHGPLSRQSCFLILFHDPAPGRSAAVARPLPRPGEPGDDPVRLLEEELTATRDYLRSVAEEQSAANSALEVANQEILSSNEELQSLNEELETAKEELQSSNEELTTLNEELHQRNSELAELGDDLLNLLSALHVPVILLSRDLILRRFTPRAAKLLGLRPSEVGRPLELPSELDVPDLQALLLEVMETGAEMEREIRDRQGAWHLLRLLPYRSRDNRIEGAVMLLLDVDALKRTADSVARARDFADAVIETVREPLLVLGADLRVERINRAFAETFRVSREEAVGRSFYELSGGQWDIPALRSRLEDVLSGDREFHDLEVELVFRDVGRRILLLAGRRVRQESGGPAKILLALDDQTVEKEAERERGSLLAREQRAARQAQEGVRIKDEFLAMVSHELRGPLSAMSGWLQVLEMRHDPVTFARGLAAIRDNVAAQERLVADLLDASQMRAMKLRLETRLIDLLPVVEAAVEAVRAAVEAKGLRLELRHDAAPILILGDSPRLQQIAWNLLSNAVKFTPPGGAVDVWVGRTDTSIQLRVADTGRGIGKGFLPYVFERFRQEESSFTRAQLGLGLGLAIVRQLAELHGGTVTAESPGEGGGATFTVTLPVPPVLLGEAGATVDGELAGLRVLVVEDDASSREMLTALLEGYGAQVTAVASAAEGFTALGKAVPDVLVSDIGMAEESGYDLIRRIRALPAERGGAVPALAFTAYSSEDDRQEAFAAGFQVHLAKPTEPARLRSAIANLARSPR